MRHKWKIIQLTLSQSGNKGTSLEDIVKEFLREYLPNSLAISGGEIVDTDGNSKQLDIIIYDKAKTVKLYGDNNIKVIPIECVYAVIEVKASISSESDIDGIIKNMESVRKLEKKAYYSIDTDIVNFVNVYGEELKIWPVHYFVFAIDSMSLETLASLIDKKHKEKNLPPMKRIDTVCILNRGIIANKSQDGMYDALPNQHSQLVSIPTEKALLLFYTLVSRYLNQAWIPAFNFLKFLGNVRFDNPSSEQS